jgi:hypothetical protein
MQSKEAKKDELGGYIQNKAKKEGAVFIDREM